MFASSGTWIGGQPTGNLASLAVTYDATANTLTITGVGGSPGSGGGDGGGDN
jgi:hypothetical protein